MIQCFKVNRDDNVGTLLDDADGGAVRVIGEVDGQPDSLQLREPIKLGHKAALADIPEGQPIIKHGVPIGRASVSIRRGDWVHLHNCQSNFDQRSGSLDLHSGAATDTKYE
jgi:altronate dehydratase small subunit